MAQPTAEQHDKVRNQMADALSAASHADLVSMHFAAYGVLRTCPIRETAVIVKSMSAIELQFERRGIPFCKECGCPDFKHEPDFCSQAD